MARLPNAPEEDDEDLRNDEAGEEQNRVPVGDSGTAGEYEEDSALGAEQEGEEEPEVKLPRDRSRRDYRDEAREAREHAAKVEAELQQLRAQFQQAQQPREPTDQEFEAQIQTLPVEEQFRVRTYRQEQKLQRALAQNTLQTKDYIDRSQYESKASSDPGRKKYAAQVEQVLSQWRAAGLWQANREDAYRWIRGGDMENNRDRVSEARKQGQDNIRRQQARTAGGRSDQAPAPRQRRFAPDDMSAEAVRARLLGPDGNGVII